VASTAELMKKLQGTKNSLTGKEKGDLGESIALSAIKRYDKEVNNTKSLIYQGFKYSYTASVPGNAVYDKTSNSFKSFDSGSFDDEIDILYITEYRIFIIEVKARSGTWVFKDDWSFVRNEPSEKCPAAQTEKHARQFYSRCYPYIPDGNPEYVKCVLCFVDRVKLLDKRQHDYGIKLSILNTLLMEISKLNVPLDRRIDIGGLETQLQLIRKV